MRTLCKYEVAIVVFVVVEIVAEALVLVKAIMAIVIVILAIVIIGVMVTIQGTAYMRRTLGGYLSAFPSHCIDPKLKLRENQGFT